MHSGLVQLRLGRAAGDVEQPRDLAMGSLDGRAHAADAATTSTVQMRMRLKQPAAERLSKFGAEGITRVDAARLQTFPEPSDALCRTAVRE